MALLQNYRELFSQSIKKYLKNIFKKNSNFQQLTNNTGKRREIRH